MCDKCRERHKYWLHIADQWSDDEKREMIAYLARALLEAEAAKKDDHLPPRLFP